MPPSYDRDFEPEFSASGNAYRFRLGKHERPATISAISKAISAVDPDAKVTLVDGKALIQFSHDLEIVRGDFEDMSKEVKGSCCGFRTLGTTIQGTAVAISATPGQKQLNIYEQTGTQEVTGPDQLAFTSDRSCREAPKFSTPGTVWGEKTECYNAYNLVPSTVQGSDNSMTDGPPDDGEASKTPWSEVTDENSTASGERGRAN